MTLHSWEGLQFLVATLAFLELPALHDLDRFRRFVIAALGHVLNLVNNVVALQDFAEHDVTAIEPPRHSQYSCNAFHWLSYTMMVLTE